MRIKRYIIGVLQKVQGVSNVCELERGCDCKPLSPIEKRNSLGDNKACCVNPDVCGHFREMRKERREHAARIDGQMDLTLHFVYPFRT